VCLLIVDLESHEKIEIGNLTIFDLWNLDVILNCVDKSNVMMDQNV